MQQQAASSGKPLEDTIQIDQSAQIPQQSLDSGESSPLNPFKCNVCARTYSRIDHLARHYRSHTNDKPFNCTLCSKGFGRADLLKRHVAAHDEDKNSRKRQRTTAPNTRPRVSQACMACAEAKLKCEQQKPCRRCQQKGIECEYPPPKAGRAIQEHHDESSDRSLTQAHETVLHEFQTGGLTNAEYQPLQENLGMTNTAPDRAGGDPIQTATPNTFAHDSVPSASLEMEPLMDFDNSSLADFLCEIMMPISPNADMRTYTDPTMQSFASRDVLNFGVDTSYDLPAFDASFPLPIFDELPIVTKTKYDTHLQNNGSGTRTPDLRNSINLGAQAFKDSIWQWTPVQEDHGYAEQSNLSLPQEEANAPRLWVGTENLPMEQRIGQSDRDRILAMILSTCEERIFPRVVAAFPSTDILNSLVHKFIISHSSSPDSWVHIPTLRPAETHAELLAMIVATGAVCSGNPALRKLGFALQEAGRFAVPKVMENDNRTTRSLYVVQAYALQLDIGLWSGDKRKMEMAESHSLPLVTMMRRAGRFRRPKLSLTAPSSDDDVKTLEAKWRSWVEMESFKRLAFHLLIRDSQISMSLMIPPLISCAEFTAEMPLTTGLWEADSAAKWRDVYLDNINCLDDRLPSLSHCIHDPTPLSSSKAQQALDINLAVLILLYGTWNLMIWNYRQLNTVVKLHPVAAHWNSGLITTSLHQEICQLLHHLRLDASDWGEGMQVDAMLVYERSLMNLHVSFEDLQLFAGKDGDDEARRVYPLLRQWAESRESRQAIWHAGQVLRAAKQYRAKTLQGFAAIALYHASLAFWAYAVLSKPIKKPQPQYRENRRSMSINQATAMDEPDSTHVWLDGEDSPLVQRFLVLNRGTPAIRRWTEQDEAIASQSGSHNSAVLSEPHACMEIAIEILMVKSQGDDKSPPPLVKNLSQLMRGLGNAASGIRRG